MIKKDCGCDIGNTGTGDKAIDVSPQPWTLARNADYKT